MKPLQKKILQEDRLLKKKIERLYNYYTHEIGETLNKMSFDAVAIVAMNLPFEFSYSSLMMSGEIDTIRTQLSSVFLYNVYELETKWKKIRKQFDVLARVGVAYLDRKASPPWYPVNLNLKDNLTLSHEFSPVKGYYRYIFANMLDSIIQQIRRGALNEETYGQILGRLKKTFSSSQKKQIEARKTPYEPDLLASEDSMDLYGPVNMSTGFFTPHDIAELAKEFQIANSQEWRQYKPWFTDEIKSNNRYMRDLEQTMMSDVLSLVQSGQSDFAPDLAGISDMQWVCERPGTCEVCDARDGMTMTNIKKKIKDEKAGAPPPLHPNCRCELVPIMAEDWQDDDLSKQGVDWNPDTGKLTIPNNVRNKYRTDLSFEDFLQYTANGGG